LKLQYDETSKVCFQIELAPLQPGITYQLTHAGSYQVAVTQLTPGTPRHVGGGVVNMTISPAAAAVARTLVNVTTPTILAAEDGAIQVYLRDEFYNYIRSDRSSSLTVQLDPSGDGPVISVVRRRRLNCRNPF